MHRKLSRTQKDWLLAALKTGHVSNSAVTKAHTASMLLLVKMGLMTGPCAKGWYMLTPAGIARADAVRAKLKAA